MGSPVSIPSGLSGGSTAFCAPVPGQQVGDPLGRIIGQSRENISEPGLRIDIVELGGLDESIDGGGELAALVGSCEGPIVAPDVAATIRSLSARDQRRRRSTDVITSTCVFVIGLSLGLVL